MEDLIIGAKVIHKCLTENEWLNADYIPDNNEIIIYDKDENYNYKRIKVGDGETLAKDLPFSGGAELVGLDLEYVDSSIIDVKAGTKGYKITKIEYRAENGTWTTVPPTDSTEYVFAKLYLNRKVEKKYKGENEGSDKSWDTIQVNVTNHFLNSYKVIQTMESNGVSVILVKKINGGYIDKYFEIETDEDPNGLENWCYVVGADHGDTVRQSVGAFAGGEKAETIGRSAFGFGRNVLVLGNYAFGMGRDIECGYGACGFGRDIKSLAVTGFIAGGNKNRIYEDASYSFIGAGQSNEISSPHSSILGSSCKIPAGLSNVRMLGYGLEAEKANQILLGRFNKKYGSGDINYQQFDLVVGIGDGTNADGVSTDNYMNGLGLTWDGHLYVHGDIYSGGVDKNNKQKVATEQYLTQQLSNYGLGSSGIKSYKMSPKAFHYAEAITVSLVVHFEQKVSSAKISTHVVSNYVDMVLAADGMSATYSFAYSASNMRTDAIFFNIQIENAATKNVFTKTIREPVRKTFYYGVSSQAPTGDVYQSTIDNIRKSLDRVKCDSIPDEFSIVNESGKYIWIMSPWQIKSFKVETQDSTTDASIVWVQHPTNTTYSTPVVPGVGANQSSYVYRFSSTGDGSKVTIRPIEYIE